MSMTDKFISTAKNEVGNGAKKYREWYYGYNAQDVAWCAVFVSWCLAQAGITGIKTDGAGCFAREYQDRGRWLESEYSDSSTTPQIGDIVTFVWNYAGRYNSQDRYYSDHVGIVYAVDDNYIYTVEGNAGASNDTSTVKYKSYSRTNGCINGYFRLNDFANTESEDEEMNFKQGDKSDGVLAYKALLLLANDFNIISVKIDNNNIFGKGTYDATIEVQKLFNLEVDGIAGKQTISALSSAVHGKAITSMKGHNKIIDDLSKKLNEMKV